MLIRYKIPLEPPTDVPDHWVIPFSGGECRLIEVDGKVAFLEVTMTGQSPELAPSIRLLSQGKAKAEIQDRDSLLPLVLNKLKAALAFIQCFYSVELAASQVEASYIGESPEEESEISVKSMKKGKQKQHWKLPFNMLARALAAAETESGPQSEAALIVSATKSFDQLRFIDSFRYSFLLIETLYGNGQFRSKPLKAAFKASRDLLTIVGYAVQELATSDPSPFGGETAKLLKAGPSTEEVIDHLVDKRGLLFHGNSQRKDSWKAHEQKDAGGLAYLAMFIARRCATSAAGPMFEPSLEKRYFAEANAAGATVVLETKLQFTDHNDDLPHEFVLNLRMPGTKITSTMALKAAQQNLAHFEHTFPLATLLTAACCVKATGEKIFDITFHQPGSQAPQP